jgi:hypothetical protein
MKKVRRERSGVMQPNTGNPNLFDETRAAERLGCSVALVRKWRLFGEGPAYVKVGRLVRYSQADIEAFLNANRVQTGGGR